MSAREGWLPAQIRRVVACMPTEREVPMAVLDAGYDPAAISHGQRLARPAPARVRAGPLEERARTADRRVQRAACRGRAAPKGSGWGEKDAVAMVVRAGHSGPRMLLRGLPAAHGARTPTGSSSPCLDGPPRRSALPSRRTAGACSLPRPTPNCALPDASSRTSVYPGSAASSPTRSPRGRWAEDFAYFVR